MNKSEQTSDSPSQNRKAALITAAELAALMQISQRTLWRLLSAGKVIEPVRIGGNTRWRLSEVERWIANGCPPATEFSE